LYLRRWEVELNLRHLKTTMKMNFIDSKTPDMVRKQVWVHLLAYNLIRRLMWQAGERHNIPPLRISFKGTIDVVAAYLPKLVAATPENFAFVYTRFLWAIAERRVPYRPDRYEPRRLKRRRNPAYPLMYAARSEYRRRIAL
ncbi:MAG: IS4 family transposase, partial [Candidatus Marinimicrobia bacterium]|nr:IS4 family transposase [Candidatus Neomarinimicrobiota bacterium]